MFAPMFTRNIVLWISCLVICLSDQDLGVCFEASGPSGLVLNKPECFILPGEMGAEMSKQASSAICKKIIENMKIESF